MLIIYQGFQQGAVAQGARSYLLRLDELSLLCILIIERLKIFAYTG
jgi:hypothetical protein